MNEEYGRIDALEEWFKLQLIFTDVFVKKSGEQYEDAITYHTNLHRRFGFGRPGSFPVAEEWQMFVRHLSQLNTLNERVEHTKAFGRNRLVSDLPDDRRVFGCFNFDPPSDQGVVKIHFAAVDREDGTGPLSRSKLSRRKAELGEMFAFVRDQHESDARFVAGTSWLYNIESYRRLFPEEFCASREIYKSPTMRVAGMPFWGQFLDHKDNIRPEARDAFLSNLSDLNTKELWKLFPMPVLVTRAPISAFYEFYSI